MKIYFKNNSDKKIVIILNGIAHLLKENSSEIYEVEKNIRLILTTDEEYSYETFSEKRGMTAYHRFITKASYDFVLEKDTQIFLDVETARGNNLESYQRVVPKSFDVNLPEAIYLVKNENEVRKKLSCDEKKLDAFEKKNRKLGRVLTVADKLDDIFVTLCCIFLGIIFLATIIIGLITFTVPTIIILFVVLVLGIIGYKSIKKLVSFIGKNFEGLLNKHGDKLFPCSDMPEGLFKSDESYFESDYISAVFKYSTKRK